MYAKGQDIKWIHYFVGSRETHIQNTMSSAKTAMTKEGKQSSEWENLMKKRAGNNYDGELDYNDNSQVIHWLVACKIDGDLDCRVYKDKEDKKEPDALNKSCLKPVKGGRLSTRRLEKRIRAKACGFGGSH